MNSRPATYERVRDYLGSLSTAAQIDLHNQYCDDVGYDDDEEEEKEE